MKQTYTASEIHALLYAAYLHGRFDADINELHGTWAEYAEPRATRDRHVRARLAEMAAAGERFRRAAKPLTPPYADMNWPPVAVPGGRVRHLGMAA